MVQRPSIPIASSSCICNESMPVRELRAFDNFRLLARTENWGVRHYAPSVIRKEGLSLHRYRSRRGRVTPAICSVPRLHAEMTQYLMSGFACDAAYTMHDPILARPNTQEIIYGRPAARRRLNGVGITPRLSQAFVVVESKIPRSCPAEDASSSDDMCPALDSLTKFFLTWYRPLSDHGMDHQRKESASSPTRTPGSVLLYRQPLVRASGVFS